MIRPVLTEVALFILPFAAFALYRQRGGNPRCTRTDFERQPRIGRDVPGRLVLRQVNGLWLCILHRNNSSWS